MNSIQLVFEDQLLFLKSELINEFTMKLDIEFENFNSTDYPEIKTTYVNLLNDFLFKIKIPEIIFY